MSIPKHTPGTTFPANHLAKMRDFYADRGAYRADMMEDMALQLGRLTGENLEAYARTASALLRVELDRVPPTSKFEVYAVEAGSVDVQDENGVHVATISREGDIHGDIVRTLNAAPALVEALRKAQSCIETPGDLTAEERLHVLEDIEIALRSADIED